MKNLLALAILITSFVYADSRDFAPIILTNPKIKLVDGFSWAMDGQQYKKTMKLRLQINQARFGEKTEEGMIGQYEFNGTKHTLKTLIDLENRLITSNNVEDKDLLKELYEYLKNTIIEKFLALTQPFLADARGAKKEMVALIEEWSHKAKRADSILLEWSASKEGEESKVVRTQIKTVKDFDQFCADLVYFLETMMRSCPIATEQFKELLKKEQQTAAASSKK